MKSMNGAMVSRALAWLLTAALVLTMSPFSAKADPAESRSADSAVAQPASADHVGAEGAEPAASATLDIATFADLLALVQQSRSQTFTGVDLRLTADITLSDAEMNQAISSVGSLSFGSDSFPFAGTFDGQGHRLAGLNYDRAAFDPKPDTGLFAHTDGATIKNLTMQDAYIGAHSRGGVLVGAAESTHIENVTMINCVSSVIPANNVLSLITNAGLAGGVLAGELSNSSLYNCEVRGGRAVSNATAGVSALSGVGLYLGAIVGAASGSTLEYCRVVPQVVSSGSGTTSTHTGVSNKYDVAIGALSGQAVYAGGIAGEIVNGSSIVDCFSTADCYTYCATYVSVGAGNVGYTGGLAAAAYGNSCAITRSHYAGMLHSRQYNAALIIPIIQNNVNLAGIVQRVGDHVAVTDTYYKPSASNEAGVTKNITSVGSSASGDSYGPWTDDRYRDRKLWESHDFDFAGGTQRNGNVVPGAHVNQWALDFTRGMPVHGTSVKATLDFPGAGTVSLGTTGLSTVAQTTSDPYDFAVQGFLPTDTGLTLASTTNAADPAFAGSGNQGYRFTGWYRQPHTTINQLAADSAYFTPIVVPTKRVSASADYTAQNTAGSAAQFASNDLFVAGYEAQVLFHSLHGTVLDTTGAASADVSDDWYRYDTALPDVVPVDRAGVGDAADFLGWTTTKNTAAGSPGWPAITSSELADLKASNAFFATGALMGKPMDLYPVYADASANIITVFEGNEQDALDQPYMRDGVGSTSVMRTPGATGGDVCCISVTGAGADGAFPDGYRFLGWYETRNGVDVRVSADLTYTLPRDMDIMQPHTFTARFEYRVDYWVKSRKTAGASTSPSKTPSLYTSKWQRYQSLFDALGDSSTELFWQERLDHWSLNNYSIGHQAGDAIPANQAIVAPLQAYAHTTIIDGSYDIVVKSDFPGAAALSYSGNPGSLFNPFTVSAAPVVGYNFQLWAGEASAGGWKNTSGNLVYSPGGSVYLGSRSYVFEAHFSANVTFYEKDRHALSTVARRYNTPLLASSASTYAYTYPYSGTATGRTFANAASPADSTMLRAGYRFLGWMDHGAIAAGTMTQSEWDYVFDVPDDSSCTSDQRKAAPYLANAVTAATRPTEVYPVYAKYNVATTTNIARAGVPTGSGINVPPNPAFTAVDNADGTRTLTLTADTSTPVTPGNEVLYQLVSLTLERPGMPTEVLTPSAAGGATYAYTIQAGPAYTFVANYQPFAVVYHLDATQTSVQIKSEGSVLGAGPAPLFNLGDIDAAESSPGNTALHAFVGWTTDKPGPNGYALYGTDTTTVVSPESMVRGSLELWPVYRASAVAVNSNIDAELASLGIADPATIRTVNRTASGSSVALLAVDHVPGYAFVGWYASYDAGSQSGTLLTSATSYAFEGDQAFTAATYTAVFDPVIKVRYHDAQGNVLYDAAIGKGEHRSFVETVEVPVLDPDGNPTGETVQQEVVQDPQAYLLMAQALDAAATDQGRETLTTWQQVKADGAVVPWEQFYRTTITASMDLYPVTWRVKAFDGSDQPYTSHLTWQFCFAADPPGGSCVPVSAHFTEAYPQPKLTVNVVQVAYAASGTAAVETALAGRDVAVFPKGGTDKLGQKATDAQGDALFMFDGALTIAKTTDDPQAAGKAFAFTVQDRASGEVRTMLVTCDDVPSSEGMYTGRATLSLPFGVYTVKEDAGWAWRYSATLSFEGENATAAGLDVTIATAGTVEGAVVSGTNKRGAGAQSYWLDGEDYARNVFAATTGGSL